MFPDKINMGTLLQVEELSRSFGEKLLFEKISFNVNQGEKLALIAKNGTGKTSLLNIIAGLEPADSGKAILYPGLSFEYLSQEPFLDPSKSVFEEVYSHANHIQQVILNYEYTITTEDQKAVDHAITLMDSINAWEYETRVRQILTRLKLPDLDQAISALSGGQKKRVALAKVLITEPDFLILDEPTNHLDVEMIEWLEDYLSDPAITLLMVTHDRYFLERLSHEILELENAAVYRYKGGYSYFIQKQAERIENLNKETERAQNLLRTEQEWMRRMPKARTTKSKARIESFFELKEKAEQKIREERFSLNIEGARMGKKILEINDVSFNWGKLPILNGFTYTFKRLEKIGIVGKNGSGKSTFLDIITGKVRPQKGHIQTGETIQYGYYEQHGLIFNEDTKVIDIVKEIAEVVKMANGDTITAAAFLNYFMFPYPSHHQPVYKLSGGEKRRLYLVTVLMKNPNFLILDEPTNDLDILTLNVLEEYLAAFKGCVLVVTHDRYFLDKIVDHLFVFEGEGVIKDFPGNYSQYKDYSERKKKESKKIFREQVPKREKNRPAVSNRLSFREKHEFETLSVDINTLEEEKKQLETDLHSGSLSQNQLKEKSERYAALLTEIDIKTDRWLMLSEREE